MESQFGHIRGESVECVAHAAFSSQSNRCMRTCRRSILRKKILEKPVESLSDRDILEYILSVAIPVGETKALAEILLAQFGTLVDVIVAEPEELYEFTGIGPSCAGVLKSVRIATERVASTLKPLPRPVLSTWQSLLDHLSGDMSYLEIEHLRVLYLDRSGRLIEDSMASQGSVNMASVKLPSIMRKAVKTEAAGIILVHNHPSGNPEPSKSDLLVTRRISAACRAIGVQLHDHIIIGSEGQLSLRNQRLI